MKSFLQAIAATALLLSAATVSAAISIGTPIEALERAAAQGDPSAQLELGIRYEHAEGVARDLSRANSLYCQAARQGLADAQFNLGWIYANGRGVPRDDALAGAFFEMAAHQGHTQAVKMLAYVRPREFTQLPSCMSPPNLPPVVAVDEPSTPAQPEVEETVAHERSEIEELVYKIAPNYAVDPKLALAVITVESNFDTTALSPKNAQGLMQLIPETAERFGVKKVLNPVENIKGGLAYLRWLLAFFKGDVTLVVAAYNAGERAVEKYRGVPPYPETRSYVKKITGIYKKSTHPFQSGIVEPSSLLARMKRLRE